MSITFVALDHQEAFKDVFGMDAEQKAQYLDGLLAGAMGVPPDRLPEGPARSGASRGIESRGRYEASIQQRREAGARSAEARRARTGSAIPNGASNAVPNGVPNGVPNENRTPFGTDPERDSNGVPNDAGAPSRTREEKRREDTPLTPQGDGEGDLEMGDTERRVASAWDSIAVPAGFAPAGPWSKRRRRALRSLIDEMGEPADKFVRLWARAVQVLSKDAWSREQRVNIDGLLVPDLFRRRLDAWQPPVKESRTPPPKPPEIPPEVTRANHKALIEGLRQGGHHAE